MERAGFSCMLFLGSAEEGIAVRFGVKQRAVSPLNSEVSASLMTHRRGLV